MRVKIQDIMRANYVERWQLVNVSRRQTVAEHSFNVAIIVKSIAEEMKFDSGVIDHIMKYALMHDLDEVITGDIPTPTKQRVRDLGVEINDLVCVSITPPNYKDIIKAADYIDSLWYLNENGVGRHANQVFMDIEKRYGNFIMQVDDGLRMAAIKVKSSIDFGELII
jgi:hypothetical protein